MDKFSGTSKLSSLEVSPVRYLLFKFKMELGSDVWVQILYYSPLATIGCLARVCKKLRVVDFNYVF